MSNKVGDGPKIPAIIINAPSDGSRVSSTPDKPSLAELYGSLPVGPRVNFGLPGGFSENAHHQEFFGADADVGTEQAKTAGLNLYIASKMRVQAITRWLSKNPQIAALLQRMGLKDDGELVLAAYTGSKNPDSSTFADAAAFAQALELEGLMGAPEGFKGFEPNSNLADFVGKLKGPAVILEEHGFEVLAARIGLLEKLKPTS